MLGPVYIAELAPAKWRGRLVATFQLNVVFGIMLAYIFGLPDSHHAPGRRGVAWQVGIATMPALAFLLLLSVFLAARAGRLRAMRSTRRCPCSS